MAVVEVHEEAHLNLTDNSAMQRLEVQSPSAVPIIGHQDGQVRKCDKYLLCSLLRINKIDTKLS